MRDLNKRQKKAIKTWFEQNWTGPCSVYTIDQMPEQQANAILAMNDHETFWTNAERFINDMALEKQYG